MCVNLQYVSVCVCDKMETSGEREREEEIKKEIRCKRGRLGHGEREARKVAGNKAPYQSGK